MTDENRGSVQMNRRKSLVAIAGATAATLVTAAVPAEAETTGNSEGAAARRAKPHRDIFVPVSF